MYFLEKQDVQNWKDIIMEAPALMTLNDNIRENLSLTFDQFLNTLYIERPQVIKSFFNYEVTDEHIDIILNQYGIDSKYYKKLNKSFKKILTYFIETAYQNKGSISTLKIFSDIFRTIFGSVNFYRIIVTKNETIKDDVRSYYLTYELEPLMISDKNHILTSFGDQVSLTGKHLMRLEQYSDEHSFPIKTNLIYIQFLSTQSNIDNFDIFNVGLRMYSETTLHNNMIKLKNFYNKYFEFNGSDIIAILQFADFTRLRAESPGFDFQYDEIINKYNLIIDKNHIYTLEDFLHEYEGIRYSDLKQMTSFKRRWKYFISNYTTPKKAYTNYRELKDYLLKECPEIVEIILSLESAKTEDNDPYQDFYLALYNAIVANININDKYLTMFLNAIFLNLLTGESFLDYFFMPLYNIFKKYLFPIELDFLNRISNSIFIKSKFDAFATSNETRTMLYSSGYMSKLYHFADEVKLWYLRRFHSHENEKLDDREYIEVKTRAASTLIFQRYVRFFIKSRFFDSYNSLLSDKNIVIVRPRFSSKNLYDSIKDPSKITTTSFIRNSMNFEDKNKILILSNFESSNVSKKDANDDATFFINSFFKDKNNYSEEIFEKWIRFDYLNKYGDLDIYLIFNIEQYRKLSSYEQNLSFKFSNISDNLYMTHYKLFE